MQIVTTEPFSNHDFSNEKSSAEKSALLGQALDKGFTPEKDKKAMRNELVRLERENKRLKLKLERCDAMLDLQKKHFRSWT